MIIFTCADQWEDIATCIYDAWEWAVGHGGHDNVGLQKEPLMQPSLFDEYVHVDADPIKTQKVMRSVRQKISFEAYRAVSLASLYREDVLNDIYEFLRLGFQTGRNVTSMLFDPHVMKVMEAERRVGNEIHRFVEFARFDEMPSGVLISHIEPKNQILYQVAEHFADRMPSVHWMIIDDGRRLAAVHPADEEVYLWEPHQEEMAILAGTEREKDVYSDLWKAFFVSTAIRQRENPDCQRNHFPLWMRRHATEFLDEP